MSFIIVHQDRIVDRSKVLSVCPFGAVADEEGEIRITAACRMCLLCVRKGPQGVFELCKEEAATESVDTSQWRGILVAVEHHEGQIHPVSLELIGKAHQLADKIGHPLYASVAGSEVGPIADEIVSYGVDTVCVHDDPTLRLFRLQAREAALEDAIIALRPAIVLVGGTVSGRALAPRTAARFRTGITADCTSLDIQPNGDLDQIRPAFGGNIMAHIRTPRHRPQFATVRYKIFDTAYPVQQPLGTVMYRMLDAEKLIDNVEVLASEEHGVGQYIEEADVLVAVGRGIEKKEHIALAEQLAKALQGMVACTRPLVENGWMEARRQIGLSGRTVRPKLIICCGISGSVQFAAGMKGAQRIVAINKDPHAPIFSIAHVGLVGDAKSILKSLIERIGGQKQDDPKR